jgi:hypothetical protein
VLMVDRERARGSELCHWTSLLQMCVVMHDGVREGGSAAEDAPPRCRPLRRGESMYEHCGRQEARPSLDQPSLSPYAGGGCCGAGERHASLTCGGGVRRMLLSRHTISILDENRHRQRQV